MTVFDRLLTLRDDELKDLVAVTVQVLLGSESLPEGLTEDLAAISPKAAAREVTASLRAGAASDARSVQHALQDEALSRELAVRTLEEIGREPELAARIDAAYANRAKQLAAPEAVLLAATLLVLALRIGEFRKSKDGVVVRFDRVSSVVSGIVSDVLKRIPF